MFVYANYINTGIQAAFYVTLFQYQPGKLGSPDIHQFTAQVFSGVTYLSVGAIFFYDIVTPPNNTIQNTFTQILEIPPATSNVTTIYNNQDTTNHLYNNSCILVNPTTALLVYQDDNMGLINTIERWDITTNTSLGTGIIPFNYIEPALKAITNGGNTVLVSYSQGIPPYSHTYYQFSTSAPFTELLTPPGIPDADYDFFQFSNQTSIGNINLNSSIFDNNYTYQATQETTLTFASILATGASANITFELPCGATLMPSLYFPMNVRGTTTNTAIASMRGQIVSATAGFALINIVVTNESTTGMAIGNTISFIPSQFTLMPAY